MPTDFPSVTFDVFVERAIFLENKFRAANADSVNSDWKAVGSATNGLMYRWLALDEAQHTFASTFIKSTKAPRDRYVEENALFSFFTNALSAMELSYFAIYAFAAQLETTKFNLVQTNPRKITPETVAKKFKVEWPSDKLTKELSKSERSAAVQGCL